MRAPGRSAPAPPRRLRETRTAHGDSRVCTSMYVCVCVCVCPCAAPPRRPPPRRSGSGRHMAARRCHQHAKMAALTPPARPCCVTPPPAPPRARRWVRPGPAARPRGDSAGEGGTPARRGRARRSRVAHCYFPSGGVYAGGACRGVRPGEGIRASRRPPGARGARCGGWLRGKVVRSRRAPGAPRGIGAVCSLPSNGCFVPSGFLAVRLKSGRRTRRFPPSAPQRPQVPTASGERAVSPRARLCGRRQFGGVPQDPPSGERALQGCQQGGVKRGWEWAPLKAYGNTEPLNQIRGRRRVLGAGCWALGSCRLLFRKKGGPLG